MRLEFKKRQLVASNSGLPLAFLCILPLQMIRHGCRFLFDCRSRQDGAIAEQSSFMS